MSLYAEYLRERTKDEILETEQGFATYRFTDEKTVYIIDIYVRPDFRKCGVGSDFSDSIMRLAKERGCTKMIGSVVPSMRNSTDSIKVLLAHGMKLDSSTNDFILFSREIV